MPERKAHPAMKYIFCITVAAVMLVVEPFHAGARTYRPSFDESFRSMRYNVAENVHYSFDDYLQYTPAALMLGLKAGGYGSRSSWGRMAVSDAFSAAVMAAAVNGLKYTVARPRPDGTSRNSFPSGHTATSFMMAAMLHEEYGWRSPWFSLGGYAVASATGISRIINDRHWTSDVIAGAVIGIASVRLGYFLADMIFKDRYLDGHYQAPEPALDITRKYFDAGLYFGYRFLTGGAIPLRGQEAAILPGGSSAGIEISIPVANNGHIKGTAGVAAKIGANTYTADNSLSFNTYDFLAGGYWRRPFAKVLEVDTRIMAGYSLAGNRTVSRSAGISGGFAVSSGCGLAVAAGENFKIKAFAAYEASQFAVQKPFIHSVLLGGSASFFW